MALLVDLLCPSTGTEQMWGEQMPKDIEDINHGKLALAELNQST
jgi:hypothetical protein